MKLVILSNKLPDGYDSEVLAKRIETIMEGGFFVAVYVEKREDADYEVKVRLSEPDFIQALAEGKRPIDYFVDKDVRALIEDFEATEGLGVLSKKFESNGDAGAIGEDPTGGPSYGAYQLASFKGSVASFIAFLDSANPGFAQTLKAAGGDTAARAKTAAFVSAWEALAAEDEFYHLQHAYIKTTHYDPFVAAVKRQLDLDLADRSLALRNVAWSTAVQHGSGNSIFRNAISTPVSDDDAVLINAIYDERSKVDVYFKSSPAHIQQIVLNRFVEERALALEMLA